MVERNLLREGFVSNTLTPLGTISGSQVATPLEIDRLADGDITTVALVASGTTFIALQADLGARFKLSRLELHTDEVSANDFDMSVSDDGSDFFEVTMTGSAGLYVSDAARFLTTTSGSPRFIRYEHRPSTNRNVYEWGVISDDSLVDFGFDGNLTELEVTDAPIGRPSETVSVLPLFNSFTNPADGFVFIDRTGNDAENQIEISLSPNGPWFGKANANSRQPENSPWEDGSFFNTRVVPSGIYFQNFADGNQHGWSATGATVSVVDGALRGTSITTSPRLKIGNEFAVFRSSAFFDTEAAFFADHFTFRSDDADRVRIRLRVVSNIAAGDLVEGARLYWRTQDEEVDSDTFRSTLSALPIGGSRPPTGGIDTLVFDVGSVPTWSGTIRSFGIQPFTVATGTDLVFDLFDVEAYHTEGNRVVLGFRPVSSGTFANTNPSDNNKFTSDSTMVNSSTDTRTLLSFRHRIMQDCIITKVRWFADHQSMDLGYGIFLARPLSTSVFPGAGTNFSVPYLLRPRSGADAGSAYHELPVFWSAKKGDIIGATMGTIAGASTGQFHHSTVAGVARDSYRSPSGADATNRTTLAAGLNALSDWVSTTRNYLIGYDAISTSIVRADNASPYRPTGTYRTPAFDIGTIPALAELDYTSVEPAGTSIDTSGSSGFKTVRARASDFPPRRSLALGEVGVVDGSTDTLFVYLNAAETLNLTQQNAYQINTQNFEVATRESVEALPNFGGAILYHELKDELWVVNCIISGTNPFNQNDARPVWDRFNPRTGEYLGTQKVTGNIFYSYNHPVSAGANNRAFEPAGFVADYGREELYLYSRAASFVVGAGTYRALVLDLDGNFKDVAFRDGAVGTVAGSPTSAIGFTYAPKLQVPGFQNTSSGVFFTLSSNATTGAAANKGTRINAIRNGQDSDLRNIRSVNQTIINTIPGLSWATNPPDARGIVYNEETGLLNLLFDTKTATNDSASKNDPVVVLLRPTFNVSSGVFQYSVVGSGNVDPLAARNVDGFERENAGTDAEWVGSRLRFASTGGDGTGFTTGMAHNTNRDTLVILRTYEAWYQYLYPGTASPGHLNNENQSFIAEVGAGSVITYGAGKRAHATDATWGTLSGTLTFEVISTEGFNFPTGRFGQVEYQLNADSTGQETPALTSAQISQGLRVGTIPAGGTKNIYVRTNIPENQLIGDQIGRLKVIWATEE